MMRNAWKGGAECVEGWCGAYAQGVRSLSAGGVNADLLVLIKFKKCRLRGSKGVSRLIVALSHKDYPCVSI
jgi:hypothetical protein